MNQTLILIFIISIFFHPLSSVVAGDPGSNACPYRVLIPTGKTKNQLPVLKPLPASDPRYLKTKYLFDSTFISESVRLNRFVQTFLVNKGEKKEVEPAYLLLSGRQGGFPMHRFYLEENGSVEDKSDSWYVDLAELDKDPATLGSMTQIFPHEMGHIFFRLLAPESQKNYNALSPDIHYFSVTTNYLTAFNEGFAEHFENASRLLEKNKAIKSGIEKDVKKLSKSLPHRIHGLERDFYLPLRMDYYRAGLLLWYQRFEDYRRYRWATDSSVYYLNNTRTSGDQEKNILYRNTGLGYDHSRLRNSAQVASNEGVINAFFTRILQREVNQPYCPPKFYFSFMRSTDTAGFIPERSLSPLENFYLKLFTVFHDQMNHPAGDTSFLQLFVLSWGREFPGERSLVGEVYKESTGLAFNPAPIPEIWLINEGFKHCFLVMDQYGGVSTTDYTINLNTADPCDLMTFSGMTPDLASRIVRQRDMAGGFHSVSELKSVPGLPEAMYLKLAHAYALTQKPASGDDEEGLSIQKIFIANGGHILLMGLIWFGIFWVIFFFIFLWKKYSLKKIILITLQKFLKFYFLLLAGLACFIFSPTPVWLFLGVMAVLLIIDWLKARRKPVKLTEVLFTTALMGLMILYSIV